MNTITYFEACDFESFPLGGTLSFSKQLLKTLDNDINLVGLVSDDEPIGRWFKKNINGKEYNFYGICRINEIKKSILPARLYTWWALKKNIKYINKYGLKNVFTQTPQFVFILSKYKYKNFCFLFAGLGNSVSLSKYKYLRIFGMLYEKKLFKNLRESATKVLAAADSESIKIKTKKYNLKDDFIKPFPTRYDESVFKLLDKQYCRHELNIPNNCKTFITTGRLSYIKGWKLLIDSFRLVLLSEPNAKLYFIGDGEDKSKIIGYCNQEIKNHQIILTGRKSSHQLSTYLNASDVFLMGSLTEGWPTSMVEAIACGLPIVSTNVSGAKDMIDISNNGYIAYDRDEKKFAQLMLKALDLSTPNSVSLRKSQKFALSKLKDDFYKVWLNEIN
jgi:glycosyltransferase involved in cell wall biosynthesis